MTTDVERTEAPSAEAVVARATEALQVVETHLAGLDAELKRLENERSLIEKALSDAPTERAREILRTRGKEALEDQLAELTGVVELRAARLRALRATMAELEAQRREAEIQLKLRELDTVKARWCAVAAEAEGGARSKLDALREPLLALFIAFGQGDRELQQLQDRELKLMGEIRDRCRATKRPAPILSIDATSIPGLTALRALIAALDRAYTKDGGGGE